MLKEGDSKGIWIEKLNTYILIKTLDIQTFFVENKNAPQIYKKYFL